ncbi:ABC transporter substrate-binding protein [Amycolatopsis rhizosphaerae]|uniref:ABC transporter substrate-binding protein n=1 Tax=Amycolatopsis rhizosphaerae TaxID=2053003 RepID=A0A558DKE2_9PSEU|nr:ABC transporter substrate-binding protein [Amycolatopsis rhizosphaerae]TVT61457.1 ABC transporter substrate-binding protein [Amycolatopsis rhizosphaerae]
MIHTTPATVPQLILPGEGRPRRGGILRYFGPGGMDHIDPACASYAFSHQILRLFTRQLFTYPTTAGEDALTPVPDLAMAVPARDNGGIDPGGLVHRIELRPGVYWDTDPPREVTAADVVRGLKRLACPVTGTGSLGYFTSTVRGMAAFADGYRTAIDRDGAGPETAARYQNTHEISGLRVPAERALEIELVRPANDIVNILATLYASPAPAEYDAVVPGGPGFADVVRSCGPYRLTRYRPGEQLSMRRNPAWNPASDPLRAAWVDGIDVRMARVDDDVVRAEVASGRADLSWGAPVISHDRLSPDADRHVGFALNPYLVFNVRGPRRELRDPAVRRALGVAVDKAALVEVMDRMDLGTVTRTAHGVIPPGNVGYRPPPSGTTDGGNPELARALLNAAGCEGMRLRVLYRMETPHGDIAHRYSDDLRAAGVDIELVRIEHADEYYRILQDPERSLAGDWDVTAAAWTPDWFGNNGRTCVQPLFESPSGAGSCNYGGYRDPAVDAMIAEALSEPDPDRSAELWHAVDRAVCDAAAVVPLLVCEPTILHVTSPRVRNAIPMPHIDRWYDAANVWLAH